MKKPDIKNKEYIVISANHNNMAVFGGTKEECEKYVEERKEFLVLHIEKHNVK